MSGSFFKKGPDPPEAKVARLAAVLRVTVEKESRSLEFNLEALHQARQALSFAEEYAKTDYPTPRDFVRAYWLLGEALICCVVDGSSGAKHIKSLKFDIPFYDGYFQQIKETADAAGTGGNELKVAERCLHEALRRCRKTNMVEFEPDILLALARLEVAQNKPPDETLLKETGEIPALRLSPGIGRPPPFLRPGPAAIKNR